MKNFKKVPLFIFIVFFITRWIYQWATGNDHFSLFGDSYRYDELSDRIISGNFNLDVTAFITAPLYPWFLALVKWCFGDHWMMAAATIQYSLVAISGIYLYKLAKELFQSETVGRLAAGIYCFFPMTMYYNVLFTQETLFQSFFILFLYYWRKTILHPDWRLSTKAGWWYGLSFLTKSHALILAPFIFLVQLGLGSGSLFARMKPVFIIAAWSFMLNLPFALINLKLNHTWTWSSGGTWAFFHNAHSPETYETSFHPAYANSNDRTPIVNLGFIFDTAYVYPKYGKVNQLPQPERDRMHRKIALEWIEAHPTEFAELKIFSLKRFLLPGASKRHYRFDLWLASVLSSFPIYILGYFGLIKSLRENWKAHFWAVSVVLMMLAVYMVFLPQARFRTITLEPLYIIYAAYAAWYLFQKYSNRKSSVAAPVL